MGIAEGLSLTLAVDTHRFTPISLVMFADDALLYQTVDQIYVMCE